MNASFDTGLVGPAAQFQNFGLFEKTGSGTWSRTGTPGQATPWTITQGTLAVANVASLGGASLTFNGGMLQATGTLSLTNPITLGAGGGTIDSNGNNVTVSGALSGVGGLTKNGGGELRLQAAGTYAGGTTVNAGTWYWSGRRLVADGRRVTINGGTFDMSRLATGQTVGALSGTGGVIALGDNTLITNSAANTTLASTITGSGARWSRGHRHAHAQRRQHLHGRHDGDGRPDQLPAGNNLGTGAITLNGGGLQWAAGNTLDISARLAPLGAAAARSIPTATMSASPPASAAAAAWSRRAPAR